jgi:hypothetical protein
MRAWDAAQLCFAVGHWSIVACEPAVHGMDLILGAPEAVIAGHDLADCQYSDHGQC